ncbi:MAG: 6-aminopenicillanic acid acyl-transferase [Sediminimonas qiaohouensis]|uniref:6-aminopenicillanic acid acyl-transferase n=1 Tax=Sediminimonas qiaohouensis TaxID=552061 RepID=A0A7C9HAD2_9RHOB|nr:C45 family peptidase [Sediminimonas qiaohouensis]MTJ04209.1 6-aminopenicillanic acid acyl-transferase [Sediminimonas qiaohouensis]
MSNNARGDLGRVHATGTPAEVGYALGRAGRNAVHRHLIGLDIWKSVNAPRLRPRVADMTRAVRAAYPGIWQELRGMAKGLDLPIAEVMAWNCRGDLLASVPDGCTTVTLPGTDPVVAHNEDGLPFFRGACFMARVQPGDEPGFTAFCYPGSLPGHTFAVTDGGLVQAVNNLRLTAIAPRMPRMVLGRAVLQAAGIDGALAILSAAPPSGGFHFTLAQAGAGRIVSVEFGTGAPAIREVTQPMAHANHALHLDVAQTITQSSHDRQARAETLVSGPDAAPLAILRDTGGGGLPIRRDDPDDPDCENTLATALVHVGQQGLKWTVYDRISETPACSGGYERA